jgi:hypothetical protein
MHKFQSERILFQAQKYKIIGRQRKGGGTSFESWGGSTLPWLSLFPGFALRSIKVLDSAYSNFVMFYNFQI